MLLLTGGQFQVVSFGCGSDKQIWNIDQIPVSFKFLKYFDSFFIRFTVEWYYKNMLEKFIPKFFLVLIAAAEYFKFGYYGYGKGGILIGQFKKERILLIGLSKIVN